MMVYITTYTSKLGNITLASDGMFLMGLWFEKQKHYGGKILNETEENNELKIFQKVKKWLDSYFAGENPKTTEIPIQMIGTSFQQMVWKELLKVPYGTVTTYKEITETVEKKLKKRVAYQAVGTAIGNNPISIIIPCHRVIGKNGNLGGYAAGLEVKNKLLTLEKKVVKSIF